MRDWLVVGLLAALGAGTLSMQSKPPAPRAYVFDRQAAATGEQRFVNTIVAASGVPRHEIEPVLPKMKRLKSELPVLLDLHRESGKPLPELLDMRKSGLRWIEMRKKLKLPLKPLFAGVTGTMPDPYREAWREWRMKYDPEISDEQIRELVLLQTAHRVTGKPVAAIVEQRTKKGLTPEQMIAETDPDKAAANAAAAAKARPATNTSAPGKAGKPRRAS